MGRLQLVTAGESHGPALVAILSGLPYGLTVRREAIDRDLRRRQGGFGRGGRMKIESDTVEVLAGLRGGRTIGAPLALVVRNRDFENWRDVMDPFAVPTGERAAALTRPRPGHVDLAGALKFGLTDARDMLERSSARSTAVRVAAGAVAKELLLACGVELCGHVVRIGEVVCGAPGDYTSAMQAELVALRDRAEASEVRCADAAAGARMVEAIRAAQHAGDSLGGVVEVVAWNVPPGLGSHAEWSERLDGRLAMALMSIQAMKGVEIGMGFATAGERGSAVHDPILHDGQRFRRPTNHAGGIEGGITNGEPLVVRAAMKPIPTLARPLASVDLLTKEAFVAQKERTDSCAVPAAAVVAEAAVALVLADALLDKMGGDTMDEVLARLRAYEAELARR
ncbi:MAG TPA: chorismate synthase [Polyangia bacterium]|jgi:chorismate synthase|nr:chorismate synthase [Polyangia bacterium]